MQIAITGARGQLASALLSVLEPHHKTVCLPRAQVDVVQPDSVELVASLAPDLVIHTAAMTDVDGCARDPNAAFRVNALGTHNVALACQRSGAVMLYISTNEVFDGTKTSPYLEWDEPRAINPYGASKLAGERYVQMLLQRFYIVRTAWLFAINGNNFPKKILAAAKTAEANGTSSLEVVDDELGNPTYAPDLARALAQLIQTDYFGIYHLSNEGVVSRYEVAQRVLQLAGIRVPLARAKLADFKRASTPPRNGALANVAAATTLGIKLRGWEEALEDYFGARS